MCFDRDDFFALNNYWMPGTVVMYKNPINTIPKGWLLCDGTNGTPDLRDRFIRGGTPDTLNKTGGSKREIITENTFPNHSHLFPIFQQKKSSDREQSNRGSGGSWLINNIENKRKGKDTHGGDVPRDCGPQMVLKLILKKNVMITNVGSLKVLFVKKIKEKGLRLGGLKDL